MKSLFISSSLVILSASAVEDCTPAPEIMWLMDGSGSLSSVRENIVANLSKLLIELRTEYDTVRFGAAIWADKPMPFRGMGGRWDDPDMDHCYVKVSNLTHDAEAVSEALRLGPDMCGGDYPEDPYEAIIGAATDPELGWTKVVDQGQGQKPFRVIAFATDDVPHYTGQAQSGLDFFNQPRYPTVKQDPTYQGGFGHPTLLHKYAALEVPMDVDPETYYELCDLWYANDTNELTEVEGARLEQLIDLWGPPYFPPVKKHPGTFDSVINCEKYEYPELEVVGAKINELEASVLAFLRAPNAASGDSYNICIERGFPMRSADTAGILECMIALYRADFEQMKVNAVIKVFESVDDIKESLETALRNAPEYGCPPKPTSAPSPDGTTRKDNGDSTSTRGRGSTASSGSSSSTAAPGGGSNTGTIAGASGGAVAGLAAMGGLAYKKFGGFTKGPSANPTIETNEEVPDTPMERESMEEVTMDMFQ